MVSLFFYQKHDKRHLAFRTFIGKKEENAEGGHEMKELSNKKALQAYFMSRKPALLFALL